MYQLNQQLSPFQQLKANFSWIITGFHYLDWNDLLIPYLILKDGEQMIHIPFIDKKYFYLSEEIYCTNCLMEKPQVSWNGVCSACMVEYDQKQYACIYTRAGEPFGGRCEQSTLPLCKDEDFRAKYCNQEYVIYLGRFGSTLKIGITRFEPEVDASQHHYRLMDQGFDSALVFRGVTPLNLTWAQDLEREIGRYFSIPLALSFQKKYNLLASLTTTPSPEALDEIARLIEDSFPELIMLEVLTYTDKYWGFYQSNQNILKEESQFSIRRYPTMVNGEVVKARGELVLLENPQQKYWVNLRDLYGHAFYHGEG